jgi:hypothetical protein
MRKHLIVYLLVIVVCIGVASCKKDSDISIQHVKANPFGGGKGGSFSRSGYIGVPMAARMYLKYGDDKMPGDITLFDEKQDAV